MKPGRPAIVAAQRAASVPSRLPASMRPLSTRGVSILLAMAAGALTWAMPLPIRAAPVGDALDRPAVTARDATTAVLLGAAQTGERLLEVGERGIVLLSDDRGGHWRQAPVPVSVGLTAVRFAGGTGFVVGHGGVVLTSDDAGATWTRRLDGRQAAQRVLAAARAAADPVAIKAAERLVADGPDKPFLDVLAFDARRALVVGAYGLALATEDGGRTWTSWMSRLDNPKGLHLYAARSRGDHLVIVGEQGLVLRSDDAGGHFDRLATPYKGSFFTVELPADAEIVVAGLRGNVWRSTDAGAAWTRLATPAPVSITASALRPDGSLWFVDQAGSVLVERSGSALSAVRTPPLPPLNGLLARADGSLLVASVRGPILLPAPPAGATP